MATAPSLSKQGEGSNVLATLFAAAAASMQLHQQKQQQQQQQTNNKQRQQSWTTSTPTRPSHLKANNNVNNSNKDSVQNSNKIKEQDPQLEAKRETLFQLLNLKPQSNSDPAAQSLSNATIVASSSNQKNKQKQNDLNDGGSNRQRTKLSHNSSTVSTVSTSSSSAKRQNGNSPLKFGANIKEGQKKHLPSKSKTLKTDESIQQKPHAYANGLSNGNNNSIEMRNLEFWHDEDEQNLDDKFYQELADSPNTEGWKADDMFEYNERMHKIHTTYNERTLSDKYTTPLPKLATKLSRNRVRMATKVAEEIERNGDGRVTPESSDDDELFENERLRRLQMRQRQDILSQNRRQNPINNHHLIKGPMESKSNSKHATLSSRNSNSTETPATASLSSSPTLNEALRPITSSSRNILRTCLSMI